MTASLSFGNVSLDASDPKLDYEERTGELFALAHAFLSDTYRRCTYHRQRMERAKVTPDDIRSFEDFRRLPKMGPEDIYATSEFTLLPDEYRQLYKERLGISELPQEQRLWRRFTSTGSTGRPKASYYTAADWRVTTGSGHRIFSRIPLENWSRGFNCFNLGHVGGKLIEDLMASYGYFAENRHFLAVNDEAALRQLYQGVPELGGFNLLVIPSCLPPEMGLKKGVTLDDMLKIDVDNYIGKNIRVVCTGGYPTDVPEVRLRERVWEANELAGVERTRFIDIYGCAEVYPTVAASCPNDDGIHLTVGPVHVEIINEQTGAHVKDGERGLVTITGFKQGSRYLRYVVGDEALFVSAPCPCGRITPRIKNIRRVLDKARIKSGCAAGGIG